MFTVVLCLTVITAMIMLYAIRWYILKKDISTLTSEAEGNIVRIINQPYKDPDSGDDKIMYTVKVDFSTDGRRYKTVMKTNDDEFSFQEGQSVTVLYDEKNPRHSIIKGDKDHKIILREYVIAAIIIFVIAATIFVITIPSTLGFSRDQKKIFDTVMNGIFFLTGLAGLIIYPRTKTYKSQRKKGVSAKKELAVFILIISKTGFDLIWSLC